MMPPECSVCGRDSSSGREFETVSFAAAPGLDEELQAIELAGGGHPSNILWFCEEHLTAARRLRHLTAQAALEFLRNQ
jgi:hypothetical protein